jgi:hypothetical protein
MPNLLEDIFEIPGGRVALLAVALLSVPSVRRQLRPAARIAVRAGLSAGERLKEWTAEFREQAEDIVAEARADIEAERSPNGDTRREVPQRRSASASKRRRASEAAETAA